MEQKAARPAFLRGFLGALPFVIVIVPFALIFGVTGTEAGLSLAQVMGFSVLVVAGASQLTALQLLSDQAPALIVVVTSLAVNLRMAMYSAALTPHFGAAPFWKRAFVAYYLFDQPYALAITEFELNPNQALNQKLQYFFGTAIPVAALWWGATLVGALLSEYIPTELGVEFAVPIMFLAVVAPLLRSPAHIASALTSSVLVIAFQALPNGSGLLLAAFIALIVGARVEIWQEQKQGDTQ